MFGETQLCFFVKYNFYHKFLCEIRLCLYPRFWYRL